MGVLEGKVALVTGSSRGIGAAIVKLFARQGARVVVHGRDEAALGKTAEEIEQDGGLVMHVAADVTRFEEIEKVRRAIEDRFGPIDVLVANAGGSFTGPGPFELIPEDGWHASVEGNLTATFLTIKSFLPGMKSRKSGNIITISSSAGRRAHSMSPVPYGVAKAGIQLLTQNLAAEVGPFGIRANCIAPETILTDRNKELIPREQQDSMVQWHPLRRLGMPDDVAQAALFLASEGASWMTGIILDVAGGMVMV